MINDKLLFPDSIVVVGGSNDLRKPGGKVLKNLIDGKFKGDLYVTNPKETEVQGVKSYKSPLDLPYVDVAIIAIAAKYIIETVELLATHKNTKGFIVLSAGFSEENEEGRLLEEKLVKIIDSVGGSLIGPNCIGALSPEYHGVFTNPIPKLDLNGCDFISGSGATACFIMESGIPQGLPFARVFSVGNSAQLGVEEILAYMDRTFDINKSPKIKLLYIENIDKPDKLLRSAKSLIAKGCKIAAIKAGSSEAGSRAASSHTGALASSDVAVNALFKKAGIVRCYGREELINVASIFMHKELKGKNIAIITHAGGPAVMLTDALSEGGMSIPHIGDDQAGKLLEELYPGSSVSNPIDFLATGTADQLGKIIDFVDNDLEDIDGMAIIFGTAGLSKVFDAYDMIHEKMKTCKKPIYPILPSIETAAEEIKDFLSKGRIFFSDEVLFGKSLVKIINTKAPQEEIPVYNDINKKAIRQIIDESENGYLNPEKVQLMLDAAGIPRAGEAIAINRNEAIKFANELGLPVVMKVVGPVHKSDVGGVVLNVKDNETVGNEFDRMMKIKDTTAILLQPMLSGTELFAGVKREDKFGHLIMCGLGGIFIEVLTDVQVGLSPIINNEALEMIQSLNGYGIIKGVRGQEGVNEVMFADIISRISVLVEMAPEIFEMDLNPLLGKADRVIAVDARIRIEK